MKLFIILAIAVCSISAQLIARKAVARVAGPVGYAGGYGGIGTRVWGSHLGGYGGYGYGGLGYGIGGYGVAAPVAGLAVHRGVAVAAPAVAHGIGYGVAHGGYGLGLARGIGYAGYGGLAGVSGLGLGLGLRHGAVGVAQHVGPVSAAIHTVRTAQVVDVPVQQDVITPTNLIVEPNLLPVNIEFRSQSSPVNVNQVHIPGRPGEVQHSNSEEEPDRLIHEVVKPVIQEVRETIVPFRRITQEVLPVQEEVHSLVARGQRQQVLAAAPAVAAPIGVGVARGVAVAAPAVAGLAVNRGVAVGGLGLGGLAVHRGVAVGGPVGVAGIGGLGLGGVAVHRGVAVGGPVVGGGLIAGGPIVGGGLVNGGLVSTGIARFGGALTGVGGVLPIRAARS